MTKIEFKTLAGRIEGAWEKGFKLGPPVTKNKNWKWEYPPVAALLSVLLQAVLDTPALIAWMSERAVKRTRTYTPTYWGKTVELLTSYRAVFSDPPEVRL